MTEVGLGRGVVMVSRVAMASSAEDLTMVEPAEAAVAAAADHLGLPLSELPQTASRCQLDDLRHRLEQRLVRSPDSADESAATAELLIWVLRLQCELLDQDLSRRVRCLTEIRNALWELQGLSPREMIRAAPLVLTSIFHMAWRGCSEPVAG
ncbi:hypothetical protein, partial [Mycobacterium sp.]|uniref:hypothetical protein n=1 Tax=Mycobacterium sp. TaxID=1785 RepID=UPI0012768FD7